MDLQNMRIFARVAALQNLSAVGVELGVTPGTISKRVQALEDELSVRLFDRTTRSLRITEEGRTFLIHVQRILAEMEAARASVDDSIGKPKGKLRIAAPAGLGRRYIGPALCAFVSEFKHIEAHLDLKDRPVSLQEDGYDVAIRAGDLADSSAIAKRLAADRQIVAASPAYLERQGEPLSVDDLAGHACLILGERSQWSFSKDGIDRAVRVSGPFRSNDGEVLRRAAMEGNGLIQTSELEILPELRSGRLVEVLADHAVSGTAAVWALYPSARYMVPRLRVLLDFLACWFRDARDGDRGEGTRTGHAVETAIPERCLPATTERESCSHA